MKEVHGVKQKVLKCQMCPRTFTEKNRLGKHIEDHKDIQFYYCDICKKKFGQLEDAQAHSQNPCGNIKENNIASSGPEPNTSSKHSEESVSVIKETFPNKCNACSKIFKTNQNLDTHIESNHTEKQWNYCNLACSNEKNLGEHLTVFSEIGIANMNCKNCRQDFTKQG